MPKDDNSVSPIYGVSSEDDTVILPVEIDPVTGRILVEIIPVIEEGSPTLINHAKKDNNGVSGKMGVLSDDSDIAPLLIDHRNGAIYGDVTIE